MSMNILLKENIKNLGRVGESVIVASGYARNCLIPQGKAVVVNNSNRAEIEEQLKELKQIEAKKYQGAEQYAKDIAKVGEIVIECNLNEDGKLFGSVGVSDIVDHYKAKGKEVLKKDINIVNAPIKEPGEYEIVFSPYADVKSIIKLKVVAKEQPEKQTS